MHRISVCAPASPRLRCMSTCIRDAKFMIGHWRFFLYIIKFILQSFFTLNLLRNCSYVLQLVFVLPNCWLNLSGNCSCVWRLVSIPFHIFRCRDKSHKYAKKWRPIWLCFYKICTWYQFYIFYVNRFIHFLLCSSKP